MEISRFMLSTCESQGLPVCSLLLIDGLAGIKGSREVLRGSVSTDALFLKTDRGDFIFTGLSPAQSEQLASLPLVIREQGRDFEQLVSVTRRGVSHEA